MRARHRVGHRWTHRLALGTRRAALVCACLVAPLCTHAGELPAELGARLLDGYIAPATARFAAATQQLAQALSGDCGASDLAARHAIAQAFAAVVERWAGVEFLRFGPLVSENRFERIAFWPDARGVMLRQVQAVLAAPELAGDAQRLAARSVAVQGLPALEYALYREGGLLAASQPPGAGDTTLCVYAQATARNLAARAGELAAAWRVGGESSYGSLFAQPGPANPVYRSPREVANEAVKALSTSLQFLREAKLAPVLGEAASPARARRAPFWRSRLTTRSLRAQVSALADFYQAAGYRYESAESWIDENLRHELARAQTVLTDLDAPVIDLLADADTYQQLQLAALLLGNAKRLVDEDLAPALGVTIGFNALDGD